MHLAHYLGLLHRAQVNLAAAFREVAGSHGEEPDVMLLCGQASIRDVLLFPLLRPEAK